MNHLFQFNTYTCLLLLNLILSNMVNIMSGLESPRRWCNCLQELHTFPFNSLAPFRCLILLLYKSTFGPKKYEEVHLRQVKFIRKTNKVHQNVRKCTLTHLNVCFSIIITCYSHIVVLSQ